MKYFYDYFFIKTRAGAEVGVVEVGVGVGEERRALYAFSYQSTQ